MFGLGYEDDEPTKSSLFKVLDDLKSYGPIAAGLLYGFGLINWMIYSKKYHLGHVSAFDVQYFITGIVPFLAVVYFFWFFKYRTKHEKQVSSWLNRFPIVFKIGKLVIYIFLFLFASDLIFNTGMLKYLLSFLPHFSATQLNLFIFIGCNLTLLLDIEIIRGSKKLLPDQLSKENKSSADNEIENISTQQPKKPTIWKEFLNSFKELKSIKIKNIKKEKTDWKELFRTLRESSDDMLISFFNGYKEYLFKGVVILLAILFPIIYITEGYENLPMEIGGVKPKNTKLVLNPQNFTKDDIPLIFPDSAKINSGETDTLLTYFYNDSKIIFKTKKEVRARGANAMAYEISMNDVKSVKWID